MIFQARDKTSGAALGIERRKGCGQSPCLVRNALLAQAIYPGAGMADDTKGSVSGDRMPGGAIDAGLAGGGIPRWKAEVCRGTSRRLRAAGMERSE